ncbi:FkbM family methyltransferase [Pseudomonas sp. NPDC078700]|uniref:FkbM family methyltransferase n=1 Tax=Pseudomonas sp. NPDC078700 TaxID=3364424 RepID=UPI0037C95974
MRYSNRLGAYCSAKQREINQRGLLSFPVDSGLDTERQALLAEEIAALPGLELYDGPTTGLVLPVDRSFPANILYYFLVGDYEEHDMQLIRRYIKPGSRVLELGGGVGLTGSLLGRMSGNVVNVCEPNSALHPWIERTFAANGERLNLINAAVVADDEFGECVTLHIGKDYWWSSLYREHGAAPKQVKARRLVELIAETGADTLCVDIEGYEMVLFAQTSCLAAISMLLIEVHTPSIGTTESAKVISNIIRAGFSLVDFGGHTFVFLRTS